METPPRKPLPRLLLPEVILILVGATALLVWGGVALTNSSVFCGKACHDMGPYYELWGGSAHRRVPCVACHDGGGATFLTRHARGLFQVAGYAQRAPGQRVPPRFSDRVCLGNGCHDQRLLLSRATLKWTRVPFDHQPHLQESRRGLVLRCTSCHARQAMGFAFAADRDPCFICHTPDPSGAQGDHECLICHPAGSLSPGPDMLHRRGTEEGGTPTCRRCHPMLLWWRGETRRVDCAACHPGEGTRLEGVGTEELHRTHVTLSQLACSSCHPRTSHGEPKEGGM